MPHIIAYAQYAVSGAAWLWGLWALVELTSAGTDFLLGLMLIFFASVIGVAWVCCFAAVVCAPSKGRGFRWVFWSVPVVAAGALSLAFTDAGLKLRVWLCESALRERAELYRRNPKSAERHPHERIGLFEVLDVFAQEDQVAFQTGTDFLSAYGIVYRPDGAKPVEHRPMLGPCRYEHLYGPWWRYRESGD